MIGDLMALVITIALLSQTVMRITSDTMNNCKQNALLSSLVISTSDKIDSEDFSVKLFSDCQVNPFFTVRRKASTCELYEAGYEGEDIIRRPLRFSLKQTPSFYGNLNIEKIELIYPKNVAQSTVTLNSFTLTPGQDIDIYIDYECLNMETDILVPANWYKLQLNIFIKEYGNKPLQFEYWKICAATYADSFDVSHFVLIVVMFLIIYLSFVHRFNSQIEQSVVTRFHELKNPQNMCIIFILLSILLIFFGYVDFLSIWVELCLVVVVPLSIAMILQSFHREYKFLSWIRPQEKEETMALPYFGETQKDFVISLAIGIAITLLWYLTHQWLLGDLIAICISVIIIRLFKFTSLRFLIAIDIVIIAYDIIWTFKVSKGFTENYKLTNSTKDIFPMRLLCPELVNSPFNSCNSLPIADIILPGLFLSYLKHFDQRKGIEEGEIKSYFMVGLLSIALGFIGNLIVFYLCYLPTPTFLYTGPILILITFGVAYMQNDLDLLLNGFDSTEYDSDYALSSEENPINKTQNTTPLEESNHSNNSFEMKEVTLKKESLIEG